ncbi:MAG TPA: TIGR03546 family protein [Gemmatimonadales bacterium]|nr:TIGR03546 family protein [Gemmatimonadales bacterium]
MLTLLKLIQSIIKTLHSEGTPGQVAAGIAIGSVLGLTPLMNLHNLIIFSLVVLLNVSFGGAMLGWALFVPVGFLLDPLFHATGLALLQSPSLRSLWTAMTNTPLVPYTNFNNTVVLGSFVGWLVLAVPIFFAARYGVARYRATIGARVRQSRFYKAITASQVYNWYRMFRPN